MADWGLSQSYLDPYVRLVAEVAPNATAYNKGNWKQQDGALIPAKAGCGFFISPTYLGASSNKRTFLIDVGIGDSKQILINNLMFCGPHINATTLQRTVAQHVYFPVAVPSELFYLRALTNVTNHAANLYFYITPVSQGMPVVGSIVDTYGANTANAKGVTLTAPNTENTYGNWSQITASSNRINAFLLAVNHGQADWNVYGDQWMVIHIGVGPENNEQYFYGVYDLGCSGGSGTCSQGIVGPYYTQIPPGTRISARIAKQYSSSSQRTADVILYGIR